MKKRQFEISRAHKLSTTVKPEGEEAGGGDTANEADISDHADQMETAGESAPEPMVTASSGDEAAKAEK